MDDSNSNSASLNDENYHLDMIINSSLKKLKSSIKEKSIKGNYKLNLFADLFIDDGKVVYQHRLHG